jgi:hypothetical protein
MSRQHQNERSTDTTTLDTSGFQRVYFETSAWNHLANAPDRDSLVRLLKRRRQVPLASVLSVAEILLTSDPARKQVLCRTVRTLHGDRQVLEQPLDIARAAASAFLQGQSAICIEESGPARSFYEALWHPHLASVQEVKQWIDDMHSRLEAFIQGMKPPLKDDATNYLAPEILERGDFLSGLCRFRPAQDLGLSADQMRALCRASDVWRALGATVAYVVQLSAAHAAKARKRSAKRTKRPGGPDIWQIVYLGCVEVFVTGDDWLLEAATKVSCLLNRPRCTIHSIDFLRGLRDFSSIGGAAKGSICPACGIPTGQGTSRHATANLSVANSRKEHDRS